MDRKMRVLWFSITSALYGSQHNQFNGGGWIESLQRSVMAHGEIDLGIVFISSEKNAPVKNDGNVTYYPIYIHRSTIDKLRDLYTNKYFDTVALEKYLQVINDFKPDLIQVFGSEWNFGLIKPYVDVPVVIHMQGFWPQYRNSSFPPGFSKLDYVLSRWYKPTSPLNRLLDDMKSKDRANREEKILEMNENYFGRTEWDKAITKLYNPNSKYYFCSEALRDAFVIEKRKWSLQKESTVTFVTTGAGTPLKGLDLVLKTAKVLKKYAPFNFQWKLCGPTAFDMKRFEQKAKIKSSDVNVIPLGICDSQKVKDLLLSSLIYIHTAYIDNSPNAVCEAQYIGLPIIATNVGGVASLFADDYPSNALVPTNDPYYLASRIIDLYCNEEKLKKMSASNYKIARERHNDEQIYASLMSAYKQILNNR